MADATGLPADDAFDRVRPTWQSNLAGLALPPELLLPVLQHLPDNFLATDGRLTCKEANKHLSSNPLHRTVHVRHSLPSTAALDPALFGSAQLAFRSLSSPRKLHLMSVAAASGSETNLDFAWRLLRPCLFAHLLPPSRFYLDQLAGAQLDDDPNDEFRAQPDDAATTAIKAGHTHLLPWLVSHRCPLDAQAALRTAAEYGSLSDLQRTWEVVWQGCTGIAQGEAEDDEEEEDGEVLELDDCVLAAAVGSASPDALHKVEWLVEEGRGSCSLLGNQQAAVAAVGTGDLGRVQWVQGAGCPVGCREAVAAALRLGDLRVAEWLAGQPGAEVSEWDRGLLRWRQQNRQAAGQHQGGEREGHVDCEEYDSVLGELQYGEEVLGVRQYDERRFCRTVGSGSIPAVEWLLQHGCHHNTGAFHAAAYRGDVAMLSYLARVLSAQYPGYLQHPKVMPELIHRWPRTSPGSCLHAMHALVESGFRPEICTLARTAVERAAALGYLPLVRYLHDTCHSPMGTDALFQAAEGGCEAVLEWLVGGMDVRRSINSPYLAAVRNGDLATLECLRALEVPLSGDRYLLEHVVHWAGVARALPMVQWLAERGMDVGWEAQEHVLVDVEGTEVEAWLQSHLEEGPGVEEATGDGLGVEEGEEKEEEEGEEEEGEEGGQGEGGEEGRDVME